MAGGVVPIGTHIQRTHPEYHGEDIAVGTKEIVMLVKSIWMKCLATVAVLGVAMSLAPVAQAVPEARIVNGEPATVEEFPYIVSLGHLHYVTTEGWSRGHMCGGTLIAPDLVLTAAHCVQDRETGLTHPGILVVGRPDASGLLGNITDERLIESIHVHPQYAPSTFSYDAALLRLRTPFPDAKTLTPAESSAAWPGGTLARIAGWGVTQVGNGAASSRLMAGSVHSIPDEACGSDRWFDVDGMSFQGYDSGFRAESMLCAIGVNAQGAVDTCQGDSGGPLVAGSGDTVRLVGITSWGFSCAYTSPGVYTRVASLTDWLAEVTKPSAAQQSAERQPKVQKVQKIPSGVRISIATKTAVEVVAVHRQGIHVCSVTPQRATCQVPSYGGKMGRLSVTLTTRPDADTAHTVQGWSGVIR